MKELIKDGIVLKLSNRLSNDLNDNIIFEEKELKINIEDEAEIFLKTEKHFNKDIYLFLKNKSKIKINCIINHDCNFNIFSQEETNLDLQLIFSSEINFKSELGKNTQGKIINICLGNGKLISNTFLDENVNVFYGYTCLSKNNEIAYAEINNILGKKSKTNIIARNIIEDKSTSDIRCLVKINLDGENAEGEQDIKTMMLSDESISMIMPLLEIENNKVRCTHGAGTIKPDIKKMFYLRSRGLNEKETLKIIKETHLYKVISEMNEEFKKIVVDAI
jgi:hypothetical protein